MLKGKKIILGVTGSIAAYKAAILVRLLVKEGAELKIIMTPLAKEFITPLTLSTLSQNPILVDFFDPENGSWNSHVDLGLWADIFVIAPATANTIAKMAHGIADNLLLTTYLSARCPVAVCPAMDMDMLAHTATQDNIAALKKRGVLILEPATGELASGLEGKGRMQEPEMIVRELVAIFSRGGTKTIKKKVRALKVLITAGPTYEPIDPVRFIGNYSSGKMGYAIAESFAREGHSVTLVSGPVKITSAHPGITLFKVTTAAEMKKACLRLFPSCHCAILAAAVADYTPAKKLQSKIRRTGSTLNLELLPTSDIAAELGKHKKKNQVLAGFALETSDEIEHAREKLARKNFDFIVLNSLKDPGAGFDVDTNKITIIDRENNLQVFPLKTKYDAALNILSKALSYF